MGGALALFSWPHPGDFVAPAAKRWGICRLLKTKCQIPVSCPGGGKSGLGIDSHDLSLSYFQGVSLYVVPRVFP